MTDEYVLELTRQIDAPPAKVWRCLSEPDLIAQWFAPKPVITSEVEIDLTPGGIFSLVMTMPGEAPMREPPGCILVAESNKRLVWTSALAPGFQPHPPHDNPNDFYMSAEFRLTPKDGGCHYQIRALHPSDAVRKKHDEQYGFFTGWGTAADQMAALAKSL